MRNCRYCQRPGHNVATCTTLKSDIVNKVPKALNYPTSNKRVQRIQRVHGGNPQQAPVKERQPSGSRKCSYCHEPYHNARKCIKKRKDAAFLTQREAIALKRRAFVNYCKRSGFGVGSLIRYAGEANNYMVIALNTKTMGVSCYLFEETIIINKNAKFSSGFTHLAPSKPMSDELINEIKKLENDENKLSGYYYTATSNFETIANPTKAHLPPEMWEEDWIECRGRYEEQVKEVL